jgi:hypothetical protein
MPNEVVGRDQARAEEQILDGHSLINFVMGTCKCKQWSLVLEVGGVLAVLRCLLAAGPTIFRPNTGSGASITSGWKNVNPV